MGLLQFHNLRTWRYLFQGKSFLKDVMEGNNGVVRYFEKAQVTSLTKAQYGTLALLVPTITFVLELIFGTWGFKQYGVLLNNAANATNDPLNEWQDTFQWPKDVLAMLIVIGSLAALFIYWIAMVIDFVRPVLVTAATAHLVNLANTVFLFGYVLTMTLIGFMYPVPQVWTDTIRGLFLASGLMISAMLMLQFLIIDISSVVEGKNPLDRMMRFFSAVGGMFYNLGRGILGTCFSSMAEGTLVLEFDELIASANEVGMESQTMLPKSARSLTKDSLPVGLSPKNGISRLPYGTRFMNTLGAVPVQYFSDSLLMAIVTFSYAGLLIIYGDQLQATGIFLTTTLAAYLTSVLCGGNEWFAAYFTVYNYWIFGGAYFWSALGSNDATYDPNSQTILLNRPQGAMNFEVTVLVMLSFTIASAAYAMFGYNSEENREKSFLGVMDRQLGKNKKER